LPSLRSPGAEVNTWGRRGPVETRVMLWLVGADNEEGSNWVRWRLCAVETGCGNHRDWHASLEGIFQ
jgi:hypothetical protein